MYIVGSTNKKTKGKSNKIKTKGEELTYEDYENLMRHSSYKRVKGGMRQIR